MSRSTGLRRPPSTKPPRREQLLDAVTLEAKGIAATDDYWRPRRQGHVLRLYFPSKEHRFIDGEHSSPLSVWKSPWTADGLTAGACAWVTFIGGYLDIRLQYATFHEVQRLIGTR